MKKWIGKHYTEIKTKENPFHPCHTYRLICPDDVVSTGIDPKRINVYIDGRGIIQKIDKG